MKHTLSLEIPETQNTCILRVVDTSLYTVDCMDVKCPILQVTSPGCIVPVSFEVTAGFPNLNLTACDLETQTVNCGVTYSNLQDGIYIVRYSVSPNEEVYVEYNHLRVTNIKNRYEKALCSLNLSGCQPSSEVLKKLDALGRIKMYIEAAVASAEYCHDAKKAMDIFEYAKKLMDKIDCKTC
jgi:hypothetical protein